MIKKILVFSIVSMCSLGAYAVEKSESEKPLEFDYQDLQLGDVRHIKIIKDLNMLIQAKDLTEDDNPKLIANTLTKLESYKLTLKETSPSDTLGVEKNIEKLEKLLKQIDVRNALYSENKKAQLIDTSQEEFRTECFYKQYSSLKVCFEYGFGKVISIRKIEKKDSAKAAEKEEDFIVNKLKEDGYNKDNNVYVKGDKKFSITVNESAIETVTTTTKLEEFRKKMVKDLKEKNFNSSIDEHMEFLK